MEKLPTNLVALTYSPKHSSYPKITDDCIEGLIIDEKKKTWLYTPPGTRPDNQALRKIGGHDYFMKDHSSGVIGVYDRTNIEHLTLMVEAWQTTLENKHRNWNDVD